MPLIIPPGYAQAVWRFALTGDPEEIVTTCGIDVSEFGGDFEAAADKCYAHFNTTMLGMMSNQYSLQLVTLYVGQDGGDSLVVDGNVGPSSGGLTNAPLPQNCSWLVRKRTGTAGRRGRGRFYIPGVPEGEVSAVGVISNTFRVAMQTEAEQFLDLMEGTTLGGALPLVVLHRSEGSGAEPAPTPITTLEVDDTIATQRRRLRP